jgi:hypothetical protein
MQGHGYYHSAHQNALMPGTDFTTSMGPVDLVAPYMLIYPEALATIDPRQIFQQPMAHQHQQSRDPAEAAPSQSTYPGHQAMPQPQFPDLQFQDPYLGQPSSPTHFTGPNQWPQ